MHRKTPMIIRFLRILGHAVAGWIQAAHGWTVRAGRLVARDVRRLRDTQLSPLTATTSGRNTMAGLAVIGVVTAGLVAGSINSPASPNSSASKNLAGAADRDPKHTSRSTKRTTPKPAKPGKGAHKPQKPKAWSSPMPGTKLSSCYGPRWGTTHKGIDFAGKSGTKIRSAGKGRVFGAGWLYTGYGKSVVIDHGNGYFTHYAHASRILVHEGQRVQAHQPIALEGSTGNSTGPHLHFEVHHGMWNQVNPAQWLRAHGVPSNC